MIRATVDVNVLISALIGPLGFSRRVIVAWEQGQFSLLTGDGVIAEVAEKLTSPRISKRLPHPTEDRLWILRLLQTQATVISVPPHECRTVTGDPEDDYVLAATRLGRSNYLVTGDQGLLALQEYAGARILNPRDFVVLLDSLSLSSIDEGS